MAKNLKFNIKNIGLDKLKAKLAGEKPETEEVAEKGKKEKPKAAPAAAATPPPEEEKRRIRAKTKSAFAPKEDEEEEDEEAAFAENVEEEQEVTPEVAVLEETVEEAYVPEPLPKPFAAEPKEISPPQPPTTAKAETPPQAAPQVNPAARPVTPPTARPLPSATPPPVPARAPYVKLGPTGRHVKDLLPPPRKEAPKPLRRDETKREEQKPATAAKDDKSKTFKKEPAPPTAAETEAQKGKKVREFKDFKAPKMRQFDARDRQGLTQGDDERWRKKRAHKTARTFTEEIIRPTSLKVRLPISVKDLASEMKLKASELIQKLFLQGIVLTLNDFLDDETIVVFLASEFGCAITIDTTEEERIQVTSQTVQEEIAGSKEDDLVIRPPVVTFMGHVDHGKTSLIDAIRKSNRVAGEAGAITQHIGAFRCKTAVGDITVLDTPGHEAFSEMRARGASVTDIVVLVVAGDEGIREQTGEAIRHAKEAKVTIVVAINKCDKPNFNAENVYRQLADLELLPESWGGQTITVNTSAQTGQGIPELLEMLALQAEVLHIKANPHSRARGTVIESELHKGMGLVATVLIQNGTLRLGDAIVVDSNYGRIKTMRDEYGASLKEAGPSTPVEITGLSGLPKAGNVFVVVKNEKEARDIAEARSVGIKQKALQQKKVVSMENMMQKEAGLSKKILRLVLRADVQGSLEALKASLLKIESQKASIDIISAGVGEISESDVQLASASKAVILGFHTQIESHAASFIKELGIVVRLHDVIYHAVDDIKLILKGLLDKIEEEKETGTAVVQAIFKASQLGNIAGCIVTDGVIARNHKVRVEREGKTVWKGSLSSLKRVKEDVREVKKGLECGILVDNFNDVRVGDKIIAFEIVYHTQEL